MSDFDLSKILNELAFDSQKNKKMNAAQDRAISELVTRSMSIDSEAVQQRADAYRESADNMSADIAVAEWSMREPDLQTVYCTITGQPIGTLSWKQYQLAMQVHDNSAEKQTQLSSLQYQTAIARHWQFTGPEQLDKLAILDPCGYFVYAASRIIRRDPMNAMEKKDMQTAEFQSELVKQKIQLFDFLQNGISIEHVIAANEAWRTFLSLISPTRARYVISWPYNTIGCFADAQMIEQLPMRLMSMLAEIIKKEDKTKRHIHLTQTHLATIAETLGGSSNFRKQGRAKALTDVEKLIDAIAFFSLDELDMVINKEEIKQNTRRAHFKEMAAKEINVSLASLTVARVEPAGNETAKPAQSAKPRSAFMANLIAKSKKS